MRSLSMAIFYGGFVLLATYLLTQAAANANPAPCAPADYFRVAGPGVSVSCRGGLLVVETDGVPMHEVGHEVGTRGRHQMRAHDQTFYIPLNPQMATEPSEVPVLGPIAITVTGVVIFSPNTAPDFNWSDANAIGLLDGCNGHVSPHGHYHYHGAPACPFEGEMWEDEVIGYAFDGFPIIQDSAQSSSWQLTDPGLEPAWERNTFVENSGTLDQCNGREDPESEDEYAYIATADFPYNLGCYAGEIDRSLNRLQLGWSDRDSIRLPRRRPPRRR